MFFLFPKWQKGYHKVILKVLDCRKDTGLLTSKKKGVRVGALYFSAISKTSSGRGVERSFSIFSILSGGMHPKSSLALSRVSPKSSRVVWYMFLFCFVEARAIFWAPLCCVKVWLQALYHTYKGNTIAKNSKLQLLFCFNNTLKPLYSAPNTLSPPRWCARPRRFPRSSFPSRPYGRKAGR